MELIITFKIVTDGFNEDELDKAQVELETLQALVFDVAEKAGYADGIKTIH